MILMYNSKGISMRRLKFTLIEMLIVVGILLFLSAGLFALGNVLFKKYYIMQGKMEMLKIQNAITAYKSATSYFPPDYCSSSQNEDNSRDMDQRWRCLYMNKGWEGFKEANDYYLSLIPAKGAPIALVRYIAPNGWTNWGVWQWDWGTDLGGSRKENDVYVGFICKEPKCGQIPALCGPDGGFYGNAFPAGEIKDPVTGKKTNPQIKFIIVEKWDDTKCFTCKYYKNPFVCGNSDPTDDTFSCGWHNKIADIWEGGYNTKESSKALYDYLCRPMKGRMRDGRPTNPKYENCKPFIEVSSKLIRPAGKPDVVGCDNKPIKDDPLNFKAYGAGIYNLNDSFELIDVWGNSYLYVSSATEYLIPNLNNSYKPYQSYWASDSSLGATESFGKDLRPPFYNPGTYDLGSYGPDGKYVNWVPMDYKLSSPSGYEKDSSDQGNVEETDKLGKVFIFGQKDGEGNDKKFTTLPSESLKFEDFDNDNLTNFFEN